MEGAGGECKSGSCGGGEESATLCGDCLGLGRAFAGSPKIVVWTAVEEVAKLHKVKRAHKKAARKAKQKEQPKEEKGFLKVLISGIILFFLGIASFIWTPYQVLMNERLKMVRGFPAFEWWKNPPDEVLLRMYVFNITNGEEFTKGIDSKLNMEEIGPYIFREKLYHKDVRFNENGTMTYTAVREAIFLPEMNSLSLNDTIIVPNLAVLGIPSYLWDSSFITKLGINILLNRLDSQPIVPTTVYNYFWNFSDPIMKVAITLAPHLVPEENMGVLHQIYKDFVDELTVYVGTEHGNRKFFTIDKFRGKSGIGAWDNETCDSIQGSTEGVSYHQEIKRTDPLLYLRKTICRAALLHYSNETEILGMTAYRYDLDNDTFTTPYLKEGTEGCFHKEGYPSLPDGLIDVSPCYYDFPIAASFPHFMYADPKVNERISGLGPDPSKHSSFLFVEPTTGVPFNSRARSQSSLIVRPMDGFPRLKRFSDMAIPMFWAEYNQVGLPWYVWSLMYYTAVFLPSTQTYTSCAVLGIGAVLILVAFFRMHRRHFKKSTMYSEVNKSPPAQVISQC